LSNVYGTDFYSDNFLSAIIKEMLFTNKVVLRTSLQSSKDYISVEDVVDILIKIATNGKEQIYNVASGENISNRELMDKIIDLTGCELEVSDGAETISFPKMCIDQIREECGFSPSSNVLDRMPELIRSYRGALC